MSTKVVLSASIPPLVRDERGWALRVFGESEGISTFHFRLRYPKPGDFTNPLLQDGTMVSFIKLPVKDEIHVCPASQRDMMALHDYAKEKVLK